MKTERTLHQILLQPTDVLFFRDGRPMSGSLAGHTAAWPLPDVTNHALHAALHRSGLDGVHGHDHHARDGRRVTDARKFGSLLTAGPFPVRLHGTSCQPVAPGGTPGGAAAVTWFFPRPKDALLSGSTAVTLRPVRSLSRSGDDPGFGSSLPDPLDHAVANTQVPSKEAGGESWLSTAAFEHYLCDSSNRPAPSEPPTFLRDSDLADTEYAIGIGIDPQTQTQDKTNFYSAHYLRLREEFRLGLFAEAMDKLNGDPDNRRDLITALLNGKPQSIIVGGQQRLCTASRTGAPNPLPLPRGVREGFKSVELDGRQRWLVKWVMLTPGIWPEISEGISKRGTTREIHPGGWLPNWICPQTGDVLLEKVSENERRRRRRLNYEGKGYASTPPRDARLVAAVVPKPIVVTGWALGDPNSRSEIENQNSELRSGAKSTHLAVPAGAVYYFEADSSEAARQLAAALNWHGAGNGSDIKNRRSTLLGEKGFGLGVCGTWDF